MVVFTIDNFVNNEVADFELFRSLVFRTSAVDRAFDVVANLSCDRRTLAAAFGCRTCNANTILFHQSNDESTGSWIPTLFEK